MSENGKPSGSEFELKGIARFSFRLRLLKKLAGSDDPIISATATSLIRDRIARNFGLWFEFIIFGFIPIGHFLYVIIFFLNLSNQTLSTFQNNRWYGSSQFIWAAVSHELPWIIGYICGSIVLLWPGISLLRKESEGDWFRFVPLESGRVFKSLLQMQLVSFILYPAVAALIVGIGSIYTAYFYLHSMSGPININFDYVIWSHFFRFASRMCFIIYASVASIFSGIKWSNMWGAFIQFIAMLAVYYYAMRISESMLSELHSFTFFVFNPWIFDIIPPLLTFLICTPVAVFLAKTAILGRIMPRE